VNHRLRAELGVVVDNKLLQIEAWAWKEVQTNLVDRDAAADGASDRGCDSISQTVNAGPEQKKDEHQDCQKRHPASGAQEFH